MTLVAYLAAGCRRWPPRHLQTDIANTPHRIFTIIPLAMITNLGRVSRKPRPDPAGADDGTDNGNSVQRSDANACSNALCATATEMAERAPPRALIASTGSSISALTT
jgi:hypothetical protein